MRMGKLHDSMFKDFITSEYTTSNSQGIIIIVAKHLRGDLLETLFHDLPLGGHLLQRPHHCGGVPLRLLLQLGL